MTECKAVSAAFSEQGFRSAFAQSVDALRALIDLRRPNAVLLDFETGIEVCDAIAIIRSLTLGVRVFAISAPNLSAQDLVRTIRLGAVTVFERPLELTHVTHVVSTDLRRDETARSDSAAPAGGLGGLSDRELEVLRLVMSGKSNKEVALVLRISPRTVEAHRSSLLRKMGARNTAEMIRLDVLDQ